jgi:hypothetical protein
MYITWSRRTNLCKKWQYAQNQLKTINYSWKNSFKYKKNISKSVPLNLRTFINAKKYTLNETLYLRENVMNFDNSFFKTFL